MSIPAANLLAERAAETYRLGEQQGFAMVGIASAAPTAYPAELDQWLADGKHGEMEYLEKYREKRNDPSVLLPGAKSVICVADRYFDPAPVECDSKEIPGDQQTADASPRGRVARYAWGDDYHKVMKQRLFQFADALREAWPDADYKVTVDTAPVLEREHASRAGLGWVGKHTLLLHPKQGSWFLLGEIITTLEIESSSASDFPEPLVQPTDHCGTCTRCIDACPTDCITPYSLDATRCISYLTIEHRGEIAEALHPAMGDWVAGCDVCQEVCPHNRSDRESEAAIDDDSVQGRAQSRMQGHVQAIHPSYAPREHASGFDLLTMLNWDADARQRALQGSALKRIKLDMFKRNALIAAGNVLAKKTDAALRQRIAELATDEGESELVRRTADVVLRRLGNG